MTPLRTEARAPDGTRLAVYEWGKPAGPEVLLIHGFAQCHLCFTPQIEALAPHFRVVAFDQRGPSSPPRACGSRCWSAGRWAGG